MAFPWQPDREHYILQPFALFNNLFISYLFFNISIMDLDRKPLWTALPNFRGKTCDGGWNRTSYL